MRKRILTDDERKEHKRIQGIIWRNGPKREEILKRKKDEYRRHKDKYRASSKRWYVNHPGWGRQEWWKRQERKFNVIYPTWWLCECCNKPISLWDGEIHLDHDHKTGLFRGWLCFHCNADTGRYEMFGERIRRY